MHNARFDVLASSSERTGRHCRHAARRGELAAAEKSSNSASLASLAVGVCLRTESVPDLVTPSPRPRWIHHQVVAFEVRKLLPLADVRHVRRSQRDRRAARLRSFASRRLSPT